MKKSHSRLFTEFLAKSSKWSKFSKMYKKIWKVTNRFSADIWWNDFRIDFPTTSESNSFPFQAFEFSSTRGLSWDQISFISPKNFKNNYFENKFPNFEFSKNCKNRKFFDSKYFWSIHKKDCDTESAAWFGLVTLSPETHGCPPCPGARATASGYSVRIFGFGLPVLEIQEVILCVICVSFKNSLFFEANYRFDKHSGFHVCLAKTFSITLCWRTQVWFKRWAAQKTDWILISSILVFFRIHHGKSNKWSKFTV